MKKLIIFESIKGAGKSTLTQEISQTISQTSRVYYEADTYEPLRYEDNIKQKNAFYKSVIESMKKDSSEVLLLDRFHYTKWSTETYNPKLFYDLESTLLTEFECYFIFLYVNPKHMYQRLKRTVEERSLNQPNWHLDLANKTFEEEVEEDASWQKFIMHHHAKDTLLPTKVLDVTGLDHSKPETIDVLVRDICDFVDLDKSEST